MSSACLANALPEVRLPVRPAIFVGRETELTGLRDRLRHPGSLVVLADCPGAGKTTLALEFAYRNTKDFDAIYWLPCTGRDLPSLAATLARQMDRAVEGDLNQILGELRNVLSRGRCLLIFDGVDDESPAPLLPGGSVSVLVTTRRRNLRFLRAYPPLPIPTLSDEECLDLFGRIIRGSGVSSRKPDYLKLCERLDRLPLALTLAARLIKEDFRITISTVTAKLPEDVSEFIGMAMEALTSEARTLLTAMSACAPGGFRLALPASLTALDSAVLSDALHQLVSRAVIEEVDREQGRFRLHTLVLEKEIGRDLLAQRHAELIYNVFERWENGADTCEMDEADFDLALSWSLANAQSLARAFPDQLAFLGFRFNRSLGRNATAFRICTQMQLSAKQRDDKYSLQAWYGNQALILKDWDRMDESLALYDAQQQICLELGMSDGVHSSYNNQSQIYEGSGRLEEAWELNERQEAICLELGNQVGLGHCYWSWGLLARDLGDGQVEYEKLHAAYDIFDGLKMERERDAVAAELGIS